MLAVLATGLALYQAYHRSGRTRRLLTVATGVLAVLSLGLALYPPKPTDESSSSSGSPPALVGTTPSNDPAATASPTAGRRAGVSVGDCLPRAADRVVSCLLPHAYEVVGLGACDRGQAVRYLGGDPAVEILLVEPRTLTMLSTVACVVAGPGGADSTASAKGVLEGESDAAWRRCVDAGTGNDRTPCDQRHTGEYVLLAPPQGPLTCPDAARRYLGAPLTNFVGQLRVEERVVSGGVKACVVSVLGADRLGDSLRDLRTAALPIVS